MRPEHGSDPEFRGRPDHGDNRYGSGAFNDDRDRRSQARLDAALDTRIATRRSRPATFLVRRDWGRFAECQLRRPQRNSTKDFVTGGRATMNS